MSMTTKEMTKHIRGRLKHEGIKARCRMSPANKNSRYESIQIFPPTYEARFTEAEQRTIWLIALANKLVRADYHPVSKEDLDRMTIGPGATFIYDRTLHA